MREDCKDSRGHEEAACVVKVPPKTAFAENVSATYIALGQKYSEPTSGGPSIPEKSGASADIGWPMSHEGFCPSGGPSMMELMADHYVIVVLTGATVAPREV
ncbi:hypothetical protein EDB84DRAFT_1440812 [Lactarius hengduanensis]|nr:hypothetical protein EDB84DRAFT_1440812 [Lactarius hengduanensis]